jgi:hypothetical protein
MYTLFWDLGINETCLIKSISTSMKCIIVYFLFLILHRPSVGLSVKWVLICLVFVISWSSDVFSCSVVESQWCLYLLWYVYAYVNKNVCLAYMRKMHLEPELTRAFILKNSENLYDILYLHLSCFAPKNNSEPELICSWLNKKNQKLVNKFK